MDALLAQRPDRTDKQLDDHDKHLASLERSRRLLPSLTALTGCAALGEPDPPPPADGRGGCGGRMVGLVRVTPWA
ncbi:hypothetical protein [Streptomyces sp. NPDC048350]|uniref:hypothetical protein n=1 Tax=Streptomyces sp. NPDC048350 TaxID=3365538 RepID=UPI0037142995